MTGSLRIPTLLALAALLPAPCLLAQAAPTLTVDLNKSLHKVSPTLYGLMTEEINYSYDGGLYAEMVRNRTFNDHGWAGIGHWYSVPRGSSVESIEYDPAEGPSFALEHSLLVTIEQADAANPAAVENEGYWGMAVRPDTTYQGSLYAKAGGADMGPVTVSLVNDNTGQAVATATIPELSTDWKQHSYTLRTGSVETSSENHLVLSFSHPGKVWLSLVSLFPPTYHHRENGNRVDLMEKLAAMHPTFLRLPGGNYLEGDEIQDWYNWKTTIGPLVDRPTHPSPWRYQSSDGLGLLEFLEWCEDLKIEPVLAVYAGYSLKGAHIEPGPALVPYVQSALDEIEYVTGDASTKWGAVRARDGHPAPFPLHYIEIGNEDWFDKSNSYEGRYTQFYQAIKAKYPQYQLIATTPVKRIRPDVIDDHYYKRADEFYALVHHYDDADRSGPKIFVGEWATREGSPTTNFGAALGDAAWMTSLERNSDLIVMASYAPLLVNVNPGGMQWESDLIGYDELSSYGSPSYYAQAMFAQYLGTEVPSSTLTGAPTRFFYSATDNPAKGTLDLKLVNASSTPQPLQITLNGAASGPRQATLVTLSGKTTAETNTITAPERILPVTSSPALSTKDAGTGMSFEHTVPPYSIQVLQLEVKHPTAQ